jgi:hypothetical protein
MALENVRYVAPQFCADGFLGEPNCCRDMNESIDE